MMLDIIKDCCGWLSQKLNVVAYLTAENLVLRQQLLDGGIVALPRVGGLHHRYEWGEAA